MSWWSRRRTGAISQAGTAGFTVANTGVIGSITIGPATYVLEDFPLAPANHPAPKTLAPSRLLAARHRLVPFTGREAELERLAGWRDGPAGVAARLVYASGGQGKTRLAAQFAAASAAEGWLVWQARHRPAAATPSAADGQRGTPAAGRGVLLVVDYAERWPAGHLVQVLGDGVLRGHGPVRVLLLARPAGLWWTALRHELDNADAAADETPLAALAPTREDRVAVFGAARDRFAELLGVADPGDIAPPVNLDDGDYARVLTVHMAALVAVDAAGGDRHAPADAVGLSIYLLDREHAYWLALHTHRPGHTLPLVMSRTVFLATLTRPLPRERAVGVLRHVELASSAETCGQIIDDHAACYPPADTDTVFEPLYPDRLGEDFLALQLPGHTVASYTPDGWTTNALSRMLAAAEGQGTEAAPQHIRNAVTVLIEAARRWPHLAAGHLYPLLRTRPDLAIAAGGAALTALAAIDDIDMTVLEAIEPLLPDGQHVDLDIGAAAITHRLTERRLTGTSDPAHCAPLHATLGWRLGNAGLHQQALAPTEEATGIYRRLAEANPAEYLPGLAMSLNNLGLLLSNLGRREEALAPTEEAVTIRRRLAKANPAEYLPDLAISVNNLGALLSELGRREEALAPTEEAATIRRRLAKANPAVYLPDLAMSVNNLGLRLSELGRREEALTPTEEAPGIYRVLAEANPAEYLPGLAMSVNNLGALLSELGRREHAVAPTEEATRIYRRLAEANPDAYLPNLAGAVNNLGLLLSQLGRPKHALTPTEEGTRIYRRLTKANPAAYLPDLAGAANNLGLCLSELGRREEALAATEEAVTIRRRLAKANPDAYLPDLAASVNNLGAMLSELGRREEALAPTEEAVTIRRRLAKANPDAYLPDLAASVNNLGAMLSELGRREEALAPTEEAVTIRRRLAKANPDAYLPDLAASVNNLGFLLSELGRPKHALTPTEEATRIYRRLAGANPDAYLPNLAGAVSNLGLLQSQLGRREQALVPTEEAVTIRRQLAEANPAAYLPDLARGLWGFAWVRATVGLELPEALAAVVEAIGLYLRLAEELPEAFGGALLSASYTLADVLDGLGHGDEAAELRRQIGGDAAPDDGAVT